jgi:ATP-dependent helicase/nuclease subunit B
VLRGYGSDTGLHGIETAFTRAFQSYKSKVRVHPLVARLNEDDWLGLHRLTLQIISVFTPLTEKSKCPLADQLRRIGFCLKSLAPNVDFSRPENQAYAEIIYEIESEAHRHPVCGLDAAIAILSHALHGTPFRGSGANQHRIAIYGVLEARLLPIDIVVLGGLNEGKWPAQPDPGPWLNRSMRKIFGLQQPEREIGVSAHDFAQGIGYQKTYLTWSRRIEGAPQIPSRWVLRLQTVLKATGIEPESIQKNWWTHLAAQIDAPKESIPLGKPKPKPPTKARPTKFSVSMVEKLIRDPYAIYASKILKLEPLPKLGADADGALRGTLFHQAINQWNNQVKGLSQTLSLQTLLSEGRIVFEPFKNDPEINRFWWTKFEQMAQWLVLQEKDFSENLIDTYPEMTGSINFDVGGVAHILSARADRIDRLRGGGGRIIDYKTGKPPSKAQVTSGIAPQLPLEAVILEQGGYLDLGALTCLEMLYLKINGAGEGGELISIEDKDKSLNDIGRHHFEHFKMLLQDYQNPEQAYYPRQNVKLEDEANDYDHLSRYAEWVLAGRV